MMTRQQTEHNVGQKSYSKAFHMGITTLAEELELALQWNRPSILFAVHNSKTGQVEAQQTLEKEIIKRGGRVAHITVEHDGPDVIGAMSEKLDSGNVVFFVSGMENAGRASEGSIYGALNVRREHLVEKRICAVFWMSKPVAARMPRLAPDFWAFRHRVVEFASKRGSESQFLPAGLFLWDEQIPWMEKDTRQNKISHYEKLLAQMPTGEDAISMRLEMLLKLAHYSWLANDPEKPSEYLQDAVDLLEKYPVPHYQAWMHNTRGIVLYEEGKKNEANAQFEQALVYVPDHSAIMMNASLALHGLGKNSRAVLRGRQAIRKDPGDLLLWRALGYMFLYMGKLEDALESMAKAQALNPQDAEICHSLAVCYYKNGQSAECQGELSKANAISPPQNTIQRACIDILNGKPGEATANLQNSLETGIISERQIRRDPNLGLLLRAYRFVEPI